MFRTLTAIALTGLLLSSCEPTQRTNPEAEKARAAARIKAQQEKEAADAQAARMAEESRRKAAAEAAAREAAAQQPAPAPDASSSILLVNSTLQNYNPMQPWEKENVRKVKALGVSLGNGMVLTTGAVVKAATYVELSLPDQSRTVPARVIRVDEGLNLALLGVLHETDSSIIGDRVALQTGEAMKQGDTAELAGLMDGLVPVKVPMQVESFDVDTIPQLQLRAARPIPAQHDSGAPIMKDGKLVGLSMNYNSDDMLLTVVNAEMIQRFLSRQDGEAVPFLGLQCATLSDPVFRRYLKLEPDSGGLYISKVRPGGSAETVGIREGDVLMAIDDMPIDNVGRCKHPLYGTIDATAVLRGHKPVGAVMNLTVSRAGQLQHFNMPLDRKVLDARIFGEDKTGEQPRYVMWGGLLFQPLTETFLNHVRRSSGGNLPLEFQKLVNDEAALRAEGITEVVALTAVVPTPATLGYDSVRFCRVEAVNGKAVKGFENFVQLLDEPTGNGITELQLNKAPFRIYMDRLSVESVNSILQNKGISPLRKVER